MPPTKHREHRPRHCFRLAKKEGRGHLKIFLGAAPGVGKTYAMLSAGPRGERRAGATLSPAWSRRTAGARREQLLEGLEILPRKPIVYRNQVMHEFDLDAALARRPRLLLVDEYAHTNVPGSRHPKRWQDIDELLAAGIDVWTTLNIQHLESLNDVVQKITKVQRARNRAGHRSSTRPMRSCWSIFRPTSCSSGWPRARSMCRTHAARAVENFFQAAKSDRAARARAAPGGRAGRRRSDRAHAGAGDRRALGRRRAHSRLYWSRPDLADGRPDGQAARRSDGCAMDRGHGRKARHDAR